MGVIHFGFSQAIYFNSFGSENKAKTMKTVHVGSRTHLEVGAIVMIKADISYSHIFMADGSRMLVSTHLLRLQERFGNHLIRIHRSYLLNPIFYYKIDGKSLETCLGHTCPISRRMRKNLIIQNLL